MTKCTNTISEMFEKKNYFKVHKCAFLFLSFISINSTWLRSSQFRHKLTFRQSYQWNFYLKTLIGLCLDNKNIDIILRSIIIRSIILQGSNFINILRYKQLLLQYSCAKKLQSQTVIREMRRKTLLYEKGNSTMLMKIYLHKSWLSNVDEKYTPRSRSYQTFFSSVLS